ncbi:MAG: hypothetical protein ACO1NY_06160 [Pseudorhodoplanes sp.]
MISAKMLPRAAIVAAAAFELWYFSDVYRFTFVTLTGGKAPWLYNAWEAFAVGLAAPLCALAAAGLAIANRRLAIACLLLGAALLLYFSPIIPFVLAIAIHGI